MSPLETRLRALVAGLDASALEALGSKGLLRRAQKDLERGVPIRIDREDQGALFLKVDQFEVSVPEAGPAKAKCSCPAVGVCQHILAAVLFMQRERPGPASDLAEPAATAPGFPELLSFTREQLESWAGKPSFRAGLQLALQSGAEIRLEKGLIIRFPTINAQCHYAPGGGLDGIIVSGSTKDERRVAVAAVIAFQRKNGVAWEALAGQGATLEESSGAPRHRGEVIEVAQQLFNEMLDNGLAHISSAMQQRLATLAVSAVGVNLPRLSLLLRGLADECRLALGRDARSDLGRLLTRMAYAHALCSALQAGGPDPRPDLVGWHRTHYDEIGHLDLAGVAAWPWRTSSGYSGLTLLFWDRAARWWNSWSESRPLQQAQVFDPVARYHQPGPWEGAESPWSLARSCFRLMNARRNPNRRLSGSSQSRVLVTGPARVQEQGLPIIEDWTQLLLPLEAQLSVGLREPNPLEAIFVLKPAAWPERRYDPVTQAFTWLLLDAGRRPLLMELAFDSVSESAIKYLEGVPAGSLPGALVIGRVQRTPRGLSLLPYSLHPAKGEATHLALDTVTPGAAQPPAAQAAEEDEAFEVPEENESGIALSPVFSRLLDDLDDLLLSMAESGIAGLSPVRLQRIEQVVPRLERMHLQTLATALTKVMAGPSSSAVLRCCYLSQLHRL